MQRTQFRAALMQRGYTQKRLAKEIPMAQSTLIRKVDNDSFTIKEAERIGEILGMENLSEFFLH